MAEDCIWPILQRKTFIKELGIVHCQMMSSNSGLLRPENLGFTVASHEKKYNQLLQNKGLKIGFVIRDRTSSSLLCTCVLTSSSSSFAFFVSLQNVYCSCKRETQNIFKQQPSVEDSYLFWCKMRTVYELKKKALIMDCHLFKISDCLYDRTPKNYDCWICCHMKFCLHEI